MSKDNRTNVLGLEPVKVTEESPRLFRVQRLNRWPHEYVAKTAKEAKAIFLSRVPGVPEEELAVTQIG